MQGHDLTDILFGASPGNHLAFGFRKAKILDTFKLKEKIEDSIARGYIDQVNTPKKYQLIGYLYEYISRKNKLEDINGIPRAKIKGLAEEIRKAEIKLQDIDSTATIGTMGLMLGNMGIGLSMARLKEDTTKEGIINFLNIAKKRQGLSNLDIKIIDNSLNSHFNPEKNYLQTGRIKGIAGHEFGHAVNAKRFNQFFGEKSGPKISAVLYHGLGDYMPMTGHVLGPLGLVPVFPLALAAPLVVSSKVQNLIKGDDATTRRYRFGSWVAEHPGTVLGGAVIPKLIEEGSATGRGISEMMHQAPKGLKFMAFKQGFKPTAPAFLTYVTVAGLPTIAGWAYGKKRKYEKALHNKEKKLYNFKVKNE